MQVSFVRRCQSSTRRRARSTLTRSLRELVPPTFVTFVVGAHLVLYSPGGSATTTTTTIVLEAGGALGGLAMAAALAQTTASAPTRVELRTMTTMMTIDRTDAEALRLGTETPGVEVAEMTESATVVRRLGEPQLTVTATETTAMTIARTATVIVTTAVTVTATATVSVTAGETVIATETGTRTTTTETAIATVATTPRVEADNAATPVKRMNTLIDGAVHPKIMVEVHETRSLASAGW